MIKSLISQDPINYNSFPLNKAIWLLAIPLILELALESIFTVVDLYFIGHLESSKQAIQIVAFSEAIDALIYAISSGIGVAVTASISKKIGENNWKSIGEIVLHALYLSSFIALLFSLAGFYFIDELFSVLGMSQNTVTYGIAYPRILFSNSIFIFLIFVLNGVFRGMGNPFIALKCLWLANIFNILLCPILVNGWFFFPKMGLEGAAWASVIGRASGVTLQVFYFLKMRKKIGISFERLKFSFAILNVILNLALSGILQFVIVTLSWIYFLHLVSENYGESCAAGLQIAESIILFFTLPLWGVSNTVAILTGQFIGGKQQGKIVPLTTIVSRYSLILCVLFILFIVFFAQEITSLFTNDALVASYAKGSLLILSIGFVPYGLSMVFNNLFNGAGNSKIPTEINFVIFVVLQISLALLFMYTFGLSFYVSLLIIPFCDIIQCLLYFYKKKGFLISIGG